MAGRIYHWKHGWIPLDHYAALKKAGSEGALQRSLVRDAAKPTTADHLINSIKSSGGFSYSPAQGRMLEVGKDSGFAVAVPGTEHVVGHGTVSRDDFARGVARVAKQHRKELADGHVLGGWYSEERDAYLVELTQILPAGDRQGAIAEGTRRNQEGIFDIAKGEYIPTGGTGDG